MPEQGKYTTRPIFRVNRIIIVALLVATVILLLPSAVNAPGWLRLGVLSARWPGHATVSERRKTMPKKPGRPVTNRIVNTIPATGEEIAAAICRDATIRQSLGQGQPPSVRLSAASKASASRRGRGPASSSE